MFLSTVPILFKKYMSYQEVGLIMMCTLPFSLKVLWSPFVDLYYFKSFGRRKSWIIPMQVVVSTFNIVKFLQMSAILFYLSNTIEDMLVHKHIYQLMIVFTFKIFIVTC